MTTVVNFKAEPCDVYIGRGSIFGNPYEIGRDGLRAHVISRYRTWFSFCLRDPIFKAAVLALRGKRLGCFCKRPDVEVECHGDVIKEWLDSQPQ